MDVAMSSVAPAALVQASKLRTAGQRAKPQLLDSIAQLVPCALPDDRCVEQERKGNASKLPVLEATQSWQTLRFHTHIVASLICQVSDYLPYKNYPILLSPSQ